MALEHALLVSLSERPAPGLELAKRFERSIGFFWSATHQQVYKVLKRMEADGWVRTEDTDRAGSRAYSVTPAGAAALDAWIGEPTARDPFRSEIAVKMRGAAYGDRPQLLADLAARLLDHRARLAHYEAMATRDFPDPDTLEGHRLDVYLVLRGGIRLEQFWVEWITEYLTAHQSQLTPQETR